MSFSSFAFKDYEKTFKAKKLILFTLKPSRRKFTNKSETFPFFMCPDPYKYVLELFFQVPVECDIFVSSAKQMINTIVFKRFDGMITKRLNPHDPMIHSYHIQFKKSYKRCCRRLFKLFIVDKHDPTKVYLRSHPFEIYARRRPEEEEFWNRHMSTQLKKKKKSSTAGNGPSSFYNSKMDQYRVSQPTRYSPPTSVGSIPPINMNSIFNPVFLRQYNHQIQPQYNVEQKKKILPQYTSQPEKVHPCNSPQDENQKGMLKKITELFPNEICSPKSECIPEKTTISISQPFLGNNLQFYYDPNTKMTMQYII